MKNIYNLEKDLSCDILIVGSGAGGSVAAKELTSRGKDCILLEEGSFFEMDHFNGSIKNSMLQAWRNSGFTPIVGNPSIAFGEGMCLGGGTFVNGGLIWRTPANILKKWEKLIDGYAQNNLNDHFNLIEKNLEVKIENNQDNLNKDSQIIYDHAKKKNIKSLFVPRALKYCKRHNNCSTGCSSKGKLSVVEGYLSKVENNLRIFTNSRMLKIHTKNNKINSVEVKNKKDNSIKAIKCNPLILACGATQTPLLLSKSFGRDVGNINMKIHLNLRLGAKFKDNIYPEKGTIFTTQIQEYLDDGVIFMSSNINKSLFASSNLKMPTDELKSYFENFNKMSNFVLQVKPESGVSMKNLFNFPVLIFNLSNNDLEMIKKYLIYFSNFLFECGFEEIILPFQKDYRFDSIKKVRERVNYVKKKELEMISVHGMSSTPISKEKNHFFNNNGQSHKFNNLYCVDASILPSNIGESPQGTIMAFAHEIVNRIN